MNDIHAATAQAIGLLDRSEPSVRDAIERGLFDVAGINHTKVNAANAAMTVVMEEIKHIRTNVFRSALVVLKSAMEPQHHEQLSKAMSALLAADLHRIKTAISICFTQGFCNTDIAHSVIGSRRLWGANGSTEITRQQLLRLTRGYLQRKDRMPGPNSTED